MTVLQDVFARIAGGRARSQARERIVSPADTPGDETTREVESLLANGRVADAISILAMVNRRQPSAEVEMRLVDLRYQAFSAWSPAPRADWPPAYDDRFPNVAGCLPEIGAVDLTTDQMGGGVAHHGCLIVRGLFDDDQVARTIEAVHLAETRRDASEPVEPDRWYRPFNEVDDMTAGLRGMVAGQGGTWLADSPAATAQVLDDLDRSAATGVITEHFGERPCFSLQKSTLRRSRPVFNFAGWHQDGSFLGPEARAMNVWVALSPCGGEQPTPGMEVVPQRVEEILPTDGGLGSASISDATVLRAAGDTPPIYPEFAPGDAMLFDERFLHRTHLTEGMTRDRYALECWFFAPSFAASSYQSFLV